MFLSIIIPVYNEKIQILKNIIKINDYFFKKFPFEIIIIDDGSDKRVINYKLEKFVKNLKILTNEKNYGKGYSIRRGIKEAKGDIILSTDIDLSTSINQFENLYKELQKSNDIVIGSRSVKNSKILISQNFSRKVAGRLFNQIVRIFTGLKFNDTQCGFKLYKRTKISKLISKCFINKFCIDVEILYLAKKSKLQVSEIGIEWKNDHNSSVNIISDSINMFLDLFKIVWRHQNYK